MRAAESAGFCYDGQPVEATAYKLPLHNAWQEFANQAYQGGAGRPGKELGGIASSDKQAGWPLLVDLCNKASHVDFCSLIPIDGNN